MASKAITVIARAGWDMPGMRMACKASHDPKFEKEARKDNAIRDASAEIALLRKTKAVYIIKMVAFEQLQLHWSEYCNAPHTDDPDDWYWYDYARECMDVVQHVPAVPRGTSGVRHECLDENGVLFATVSCGTV